MSPHLNFVHIMNSIYVISFELFMKMETILPTLRGSNFCIPVESSWKYTKMVYCAWDTVTAHIICSSRHK